jgi:hypothetical protein
VDILKTLPNPGWVGSLISLSGLIAALLIYRASRVGARPVFQAKVLRLLSEANPALPPDVEIFFRGSSVPRLTRVQIIFWNSGTTLLRGSDIVQDDPLRFSFQTPGKILSASVAKVTRGTNKFATTIPEGQPNELLCQFDYLDPGDGATIDLLHTAEHGPWCLGTIWAVPAGVQDWSGSGLFSPELPAVAYLTRFMRAVGVLAPVFGVLLIALAFYVDRWDVRFPLLFLGLIYLLGGLADWRIRRRVSSQLRMGDF